jgi:hypothetical protein
MKKVTFIFVCLSFATLCQAKTITVDDDGPADFNNIQAAIDYANDGDTILVADGTYRGDGNRDIDFKGESITLRSENGPENCIIDCQHSGGGFSFHSGEDKNSVLEGFVIVNGSGGGGGAMTVHHSSPLLINCKFINNAGGGGGAICVYGSSSIILINCTFSGNSVGGEGGGGYTMMVMAKTPARH